MNSHSKSKPGGANPQPAPRGGAGSETRRVALVTGASRGLARAVALAMRDENFRVHGMARNSGRSAALKKELGAESVHGGDVRDPDAAEKVVHSVLAAEGRLDLLVLGVGTYLQATLEDTSAAQFEELLQTNLLGSIRMVDAARSALRSSGGHILFFGAAGLATRPVRTGSAAFTVAKAALLSYMRSLALQEASSGVRVNMLSPGIVPHEGASSDTNDPTLWETIPLGRPAELGDITDAALWLMKAEHVTGQNLDVAGGFLL